MVKPDITITSAKLPELEALLEIEEQSFASDRLSRRSIRRFLTSEHSVFLVAKIQQQCVGYLLIIFHRGTRLGRLYSIAVSSRWRGYGIARKLIKEGEKQAQEKGALYFRLEVSHTNTNAIALYHSLGFHEFEVLQDYYEDHTNALRMQKRIRFHNQSAVHTVIPWCRQTTPFTCGPAALMMAMAGLDKNYPMSLAEELQIWREATTIFMTSGHGGCHPLGLALAGNKRSYTVEVWLNQKNPLFIDGVRDENKKNIIETVHNEFVKQIQEKNIPVYHSNINAKELIAACDRGAVPLVLISTYRLDKKKAPHWVVISGYDEECFYLHDPDPNDKHQDLFDCQYLPIAHEDFEPMSSFGRNRLRTAIILSCNNRSQNKSEINQIFD